MGMPGGSVQDVRRDADTVASALLAVLADSRRNENMAAAVLVGRLHELGEVRLAAEMAIFDLGTREVEPDVALARRTVQCESAVAMSLSKAGAAEMMVVGEQLAHRLPRVAEAFAAGDLDYPRVKTIANILVKACDDTVAALEVDILAAALRYSPRGLRAAIWSAWMRHDSTEARTAREKAEHEERCADVRLGDDGIARLSANITAVEGAECDAILNELAATVCASDPRTVRQLRGYALMALVHREESIACRCRLGDSCPVAGSAVHRPGRRVPLIQIMIDIQTLLGLAAEPATLADGSPLDPEVARTLAADAQWQGLLTELVEVVREMAASTETDSETERGEPEGGVATAAAAAADPGADLDETRTSATDSAGTGTECGTDEDEHSSDANGSTPDEDGGSEPPRPSPTPRPGPTSAPFAGSGLSASAPGPSAGSGPSASAPGQFAGSGPSTGPGPSASAPTSAGTPPGHAEGSESHSPERPGDDGPRARHLLHRSRTRRAGKIPTPASPAAPRSPIGEQRAASDAVAAMLAAIAAEPALGRGLHPDGHCEPPPGALTYAPSRALVALVRASYSTCTFPGCCTPSASCEIDHIVPYHRAEPRGGGWTILENLQPVCTFHHQAKTLKLWSCSMLAGGSIYWLSAAGLERITLPKYGAVLVPTDYAHRRTPRSDTPQPISSRCAEPIVDDSHGANPPGTGTNTDTDVHPEWEDSEHTDLLYEPTWWETNITATARETSGRSYAPTLADIAQITDPRARADATYLRDRYLEHLQVVAAREKLRPPPF